MLGRSSIGKQNKNGSITAVHCNWYGSPNHTGLILRDNYTSDIKVYKLIALGNLSRLGEDIGVEHHFNHVVPHWCKAYGRDRGDSNQQARVFKSVDAIAKSFPDIKYIYVWTEEGIWKCFTKKLQSIDLYSLTKARVTSHFS